MIDDPLKVDNESREKIIDGTNKNYFVVANAGSGKTSILVNRMVAMVEKGIDVSKICAITFTKNAATEFFDRFQKKLKERSVASDSYKKLYPGDLGTPNGKTREYCKNALKNIDLCFLGTIDSFCNKVLSEFPLDANIPSSSMVISDEDQIKMYKKEYEKISRNENSPYYADFCNFVMLNNNAEKVFANSIKSVIDALVLPLQYNKPTKDFKEAFKDFKATYGKKIIKDLDVIHAFKDDYPKLDGSGKQTDKFKDAMNDFEDKYLYFRKELNLEGFINKLNDIKKTVSELRFTEVPNTEIITFVDKGKYSKYPDGKKEGSSRFDELLDELNDIKYSYSIDFMVKISNEINKHLREMGMLSFNDYLLIFRDLLKKDMNNGMNIIKHIRNTYEHYLIDESQDTSPVQTELFLYLTSKTPFNTIEECKPIPGSLFILGDPKQSIYRFRNADVTTYLNTLNLFKETFDDNNEVLYLTKNFRSTELLINYFNKAFKKMKNYEQIPMQSVINGESGLFTTNSYLGLIKTMYHNDDFKVCVKIGEDKVLRAPEFEDFMIITKTKPAQDGIIKELRDNHIPVYIEGVVDLAASNTVKAIYAIYRYIAEKDDKASLSNLLVSPVFNMKYHKAININRDNIPEKLKPYFAIIDSIDEKNPIVLFEKIMDERFLFQNTDYYNIEYAYFALENLKDAYLKNTISTPRDAVLFFEEFLLTAQERVMSMNYKPNAVHIANLHKVKGLEAPIVYLAKAGINYNPITKSRNDYVNNKSYIFKTDENDGPGGNKFYNIKTSIYKKEEELELDEAKDENERLKYVAATRARSFLVINNDYKTEKNPKGGGFWGSLITDDFKEFVVDEDKKIKFPEKDINELVNNTSISFDSEKSYEIQSPSKLERIHSSFDELDDDFDSLDNIDGKIKGTIIHRLMEKLVSARNNKKEDLIDGILFEYGLTDEKIYKDILNSVYDTMTHGGYEQANGRNSDILEELKDAECHCEVPFSYLEGDEVWYGNIDLLYVKNGKYYIVDYKTNLEGEDLEKEYKNQLEAYKNALKKLKGIDAETYIYHINLKK